MANATVSTAWRRQPVRPVAPGTILVAKGKRRRPVRSRDAGSQISASLRQDVARHPNDFVVFDTRSAASRFMLDHISDVSRETERRMVDSGVVGYWRGKTLVVLPIVSSMVDGASPEKN
ncbi:MAG TPA: hypothetical protein VIM60_10280 [Edaphobacter sp.]